MVHIKKNALGDSRTKRPQRLVVRKNDLDLPESSRAELWAARPPSGGRPGAWRVHKSGDVKHLTRIDSVGIAIQELPIAF